MAADVHAVALVAHGARDAAHVVEALDDDGMDVGPGEQFVGGGQSRRAGADDDCLWLHSEFISKVQTCEASLPADRGKPG